MNECMITIFKSTVKVKRQAMPSQPQPSHAMPTEMDIQENRYRYSHPGGRLHALTRVSVDDDGVTVVVCGATRGE